MFHNSLLIAYCFSVVTDFVVVVLLFMMMMMVMMMMMMMIIIIIITTTTIEYTILVKISVWSFTLLLNTVYFYIYIFSLSVAVFTSSLSKPIRLWVVLYGVHSINEQNDLCRGTSVFVLSLSFSLSIHVDPKWFVVAEGHFYNIHSYTYKYIYIYNTHFCSSNWRSLDISSHTYTHTLTHESI